MKENITSKDVRFHHRICDAQKHLLHRTGNVINIFQESRKIVRIVVGGHKGLSDVKENQILWICKTVG